MRYSKYTFILIAQAILLSLTALAFYWSLQQEFMTGTSIGLGLLWLVELVLLLLNFWRLRRDYQRFVDAIRYEDMSLSFKRERKDAFFKDLHSGFNEIINDFRLVRKEKEADRQFFEICIEKSASGLLAFQSEGRVLLQNRALLEILGCSKLKSVKELKKVDRDFPDLLMSMQHGEEQSLKIPTASGQRDIKIAASRFKQEEQSIHLFSFQDISRDIYASEVESWQKLIQVLRHEITNSISPIRILSTSLIKLTEQEGRILLPEEIEPVHLENVNKGLRAIQKRTKGLGGFIESYRSLTKIPEPELKQFEASAFVERIVSLFEQTMEEKGINLSIHLDERNSLLYTDEHLLEQVLINLLKNAIEALEEHPDPKLAIYLTAERENHQFVLEDNGPGISQELQSRIFVPFFTTKKEGNGIGLPLSRQIMYRLKGQLLVGSEPGKGSRFRVEFPRYGVFSSESKSPHSGKKG